MADRPTDPAVDRDFARDNGWDAEFETFSDFDLPTYVGPTTFMNLPWITDPAELRRRAVDVAIVPSPAQREGNFQGLSPIYDPLTTVGNARTTFPGNAIPAQRIARAMYPFMTNLESGKFVQKVKYGCELLGLDCGETRRPLLGLTEAEKAEFRLVFDQAKAA